MPRQQGIIAPTPFTKGLITETTPLYFPEEAATDTDNCVFDEKGRITRRGAIDLEPSYSSQSITYTDGGDATVEFNWNQVGSSPAKSFLVQQIGAVIHFFDTSDTVTLGAAETFTIDLSNYSDDGVSTNIRLQPCSFDQGRGFMYITNEYMPILQVGYNAITDDITVTERTIYIRDTEGLDDGLGVNERPTDTLSSISNEEHVYNLLNQGWFTEDNGGSDALAQWDTARTDLPSNADRVSFYRASETDAFAPTYITAGNDSPGNTAAPRGHYIYELGNYNPAVLAGQDSISLTSLGNSSSTQIPNSVGSVEDINTFTDAANAFDDDINQAAAACARKSTANGFYQALGRDYSVEGGYIITKVEIVSPNDDADLVSTGGLNLRMYGKNGSAPAHSSDGTLISTATNSGVGGSGNNSVYTIDSIDLVNSYEYVWVAAATTVSATIQYAEMRFYTFAEGVNPRPSQIMFFNGRLFYGGFVSAEQSNKIYFTQVIERDEQEEFCYQNNDPTAENITDIVASDGGVIEVSGMGRVYGMFSFQNQIVVMADNGTWTIKGTDGPFSATGYSVRKISSIGMDSPLSVVDVKGLPIWWAEDGIYTVAYDANYDSTVIKSVTEETIKTYILDIPGLNRKFVKGAYDRLNDVVYWIFNDTASLASTEYYQYNKCLCLNTKSGAFYPWSFTESAVTPQYVVGVAYITPKDRETTALIKFPIYYDNSGDYLSYAQENLGEYTDWTDYATYTTEADTMTYSSYFVTGYRIDGEGARNFQHNYIFVFMDELTNSSMLVRNRYGFTDSASSNRWSTAQQCYKSTTNYNQEHEVVRRTRLKMRGHGEVVQLYFYSVAALPFSVIGWTRYASLNQGI